VYEQHAFYDFCDQNGIMVWQDSTMACAAFPQDAGFLGSMRQETQSVVKKLRNHACIMLWIGDNECDELLYQEGVNPAENKITREIYPEVIHNNDHGRPYLPCSPFKNIHFNVTSSICLQITSNVRFLCYYLRNLRKDDCFLLKIRTILSFSIINLTFLIIS